MTARHRARTWALLALARATDTQTPEPTAESETP